MKITEIKVVIREEGSLRAFVTIILDQCFAVRNLKIVKATDKLLLCMPSRKSEDGSFKDIAHPINKTFRSYLEKEIMVEYEKTLKDSVYGKV